MNRNGSSTSSRVFGTQTGVDRVGECRICRGRLSRYNDSGLCQACTRHSPSSMLPAAAQWLAEGAQGQAAGTLDWQVVLQTVMRETKLSTTAIATATGLSQSYISRLANGKSRSPSMRSVQALCDGLGVPRGLAGLASVVNDGGETQRGTVEVSDTNRRAMITSLVAVVAGGPIARLLHGAAERRATHDDAQAVRQLVRHLDSLDDRFGGGSLCDVAAQCVGTVENIIDHSSYGEAAGTELQAAYGELVGYTGWLNFDACRHIAAKALFNEALCVAQLVDDRDLEVFLLASLSLQARHLNRPRGAVQYAERARHRARGIMTPRLEALLLSREAAGWAGLGDRGAFHRLSRSAHATYVAPTDDDPPWIAFLDEAELTVTDALSWRLLDDLARAETLLRRAIDAIPDTRQRNQASYRIALADVLAHRGDIAGACQTAELALPRLGSTSSGRARERWADTWTTLKPHNGKAAVRDLAQSAHRLGLLSKSEAKFA